AVNHSSNHLRGPEHSIVRTPRIMLTAPGPGTPQKGGLSFNCGVLPSDRGEHRQACVGSASRRFLRFSRLSPVDGSRKLTAATSIRCHSVPKYLRAVSSRFLAFLRLTPRVS